MNRSQGPDTVLGDGIPSLPDRRAVEIRESGTPWTLRSYASRAEWETRAAHIRQHILACAGLWPLPERSLLRSRVFGRIDREDIRGANRSFPSAWAREAYRAAGGARRLTISHGRGNHEALVGWLIRG